MSDATLTQQEATRTSALEPAAVASAPRLLILTPDTGLMLRLVNAAEREGWEAIWRPTLDYGPDAPAGWTAVALDADFGTPAFQAATKQGLTLLGVIGWWDRREVELGLLCRGFLHRPMRGSEVREVLAAVSASATT
jgi:hypothetical protein